MAEYSAEENARRLKAWNAWKEVCWVHGLGKPRGELPIVGTEDDEHILSKMIENAFRRKLMPYMIHLEDGQGRFSFSSIDCAQVFDGALCEYEHVDRYKKGHFGEKEYLRKKKAWKDDVWQVMSVSKDHPLKVIVGKLLGNGGVIDEIVEDWLRANFSCHKDGQMLVFHHSMDVALENGEKVSEVGEAEGYRPDEIAVMEGISPGSTGDAVVEEQDMDGRPEYPEDIAVPVAWAEELNRAFPLRICCLILAHVNGVKLYADKEVLSALGISKTTAADGLNRAQECLVTLNPELRDWIICDAAGTRFFRNWIECRCRAEKAGQLILSRIEGNKVKAK